MPRKSLVVNISAHQRRPAHSILRELEWTIRTTEEADCVDVVAHGDRRESVEILLRNIARLTGPTVARAARTKTDLGSGYDVAFVSVISFRDLWILGGLDLRSVAERRICYILELWSPDVHHFGLYREILEQFDAVFTVHQSSISALRAAVDVPVHWLPTGTDTALHTPPTLAKERGLDVFSLGRRCPVQHAELVAAARDGVLSYQFDSLAAGAFDDWQEHRLNAAGQGQRATFYIAHRAKFDVPVESGDAQDFGNRFFDAAASGAIPLGEIPTNENFRSYFPDADDMLRVPAGTAGIVDALLEMGADVERCRSISSRLVVDALQRHDWLHRWRTMLEAVDLAPLPSTRDRLGRLETMASLVEAAEPYAEVRADLVRAQWGAGA